MHKNWRAYTTAHVALENRIEEKEFGSTCSLKDVFKELETRLRAHWRWTGFVA